MSVKMSAWRLFSKAKYQFSRYAFGRLETSSAGATCRPILELAGEPKWSYIV